MAGKQAEPANRFMQAAATYPIIIERAGKNWGAYAPDLPGCVAAADSPEETEALMREAIAFHLEGMEEDGEPWPMPGSHTAA
jgi:predicted RNase H-like HicB family nuclease